MRPDWNTYWMNIATAVSLRSPDTKHKVGAICVSMDNSRLMGIGYNGDATGMSNERMSQEQGKSGFLHAETNLAIHVYEPRSVDKKVYITLAPCYNCAMILLNMGVKEIYYKESYPHDTSGLDLLFQKGVDIHYIGE